MTQILKEVDKVEILTLQDNYIVPERKPTSLTFASGRRA